MNIEKKVVVSWSGGKDSLMALWKLPSEYQVVALLTNINAEQDRVSIHGVRRQLIEAQAAALGLPVQFINMPSKPTNAEYESQLTNALIPFKSQGIDHIVYGDLFLEDIRVYREAYLEKLGLHGVYPIWGVNTRTLISEFVAAGFKTLITCVDTPQLDAAFVGRTIDADFLRDLPSTVDPCGENGEFHTFVYDGPLFRQPVPITLGATWLQDDRFCYGEVT